MKKILVLICLSTGLISTAQQIDYSAAKKDTSAISNLKKTKFSSGTNLVTNLSNGYSLHVKLLNRRTPEFMILSSTGSEVPSVIYNERTRCWRCFVDENGRNECVEISCPENLKPWDGRRKKKRIL